MKRSTRRRLTHAALYAVLAVVAITVWLVVDWPAVARNFFRVDVMLEVLGDFVLRGARNTVIYTAIAFTGGLLLGILLALMKMSPVGLYRWLATAYIEFFRGLPALLVMLAFAFGVPIATGWMPPGGTVGAGILALILVAGAYMAETLRAGIQAVPKGQAEAARSLGMSPSWTMATVVMPQAFRIVIPPLTNEFVLLIKDTALLFVVGLMASQRELLTMAQAGMTSGPGAQTATTLTLAALLYLAITLPLTRLVAWLESRQARAR